MLLFGGVVLAAAVLVALAAAPLLACQMYGARRVVPLAVLIAGGLALQFTSTLAFAVLAGVIAGVQVERRRSYGQIIAAVALSGMVRALQLLLAADRGKETLEQVGKQLEVMGLESAEEDLLRHLVDIMLRLQPGTEFIFLLLIAVLAYGLGRFLAEYLRVSLPAPLPFALWRPWQGLIWVLVGGLALKFMGSGVVGDLGFNLAVVMLILYAVQGLALVRFYLQRLGIIRRLELLLYALLVPTAGLSMLLLAVLGLLDTWFDWRHLEPEQQRPPTAGGDSA